MKRLKDSVEELIAHEIVARLISITIEICDAWLL